MKYNKSMLPKEVDWEEAQIKAYGELEPEFEKYWQELIAAIPAFNSQQQRGYHYHSHKLSQREQVKREFIGTVPSSSFHRMSKGTYLSDEDFIVYINCPCGNKIFCDMGDKLLCEECGRVYWPKTSISQSDYLLDDSSEISK